MNASITTINNNTMNLDVRELTKMIISGNGKLFRAVFTKKDGSVRTMVFTPSIGWNRLNGIDTTSVGAKMVNTKCGRNMATVCERLDNGVFQPRTLNLEKVISLELV